MYPPLSTDGFGSGSGRENSHKINKIFYKPYKIPLIDLKISL
jgi:hypothetical protein